jgi:hypothetical protein
LSFVDTVVELDDPAILPSNVPVFSNSYAFKAPGSGANLKGIVNPVNVTLTIGDDTGTTQVKAQIS